MRRAYWQGDWRFNTQPPEGGCLYIYLWLAVCTCFNTQPPEGGCCTPNFVPLTDNVSTHSRPKAAAALMSGFFGVYMVSTHSRPKAAAAHKDKQAMSQVVSTHSRPKAAALLVWTVGRGF